MRGALYLRLGAPPAPCARWLRERSRRIAPPRPLGHALWQANATAALVPALRNATQALQLLSKALDYLAVRSSSYCAEDADYSLTPGARAMVWVTAVLCALVLLSTAVARVLRPACEARGLPTAGLGWAVHFDAVGNARRLLATRSAGELDFCDGLRCLSTGYVQLGHLFLIAAFGSKNVVPAVSDYLRSFEVVAILGAFSAVDTFFWLSGLLAALALLRRARPRGAVSVRSGLAQWAVALLHRFARLLPVYAYVLFFYTHLLPLVGSGPLWPQVQPMGEACTRTWWTNLLFVNNLVGEGDAVGTAGCMGWSWYLANDMQFFALAALALPFYAALPRLVVAYFSAALALSVVASGVLSRIHAADITTLDRANGAYLYNEPYTRCGSYAVGCLFAIFLHERAPRAGSGTAAAADGRPPRARGRPQPATWLELCGWLASAGLLLAVFLLPWSDLSGGGLFQKSAQRWPQWAKDLYNASQRQLWAVGLCGLSHWLLSGRGALLRAFLAAPVWQVLAKLSYGAYLWHLVFIFVLYFSALDYKPFSRLDVAVSYVSVLVGSYGLSLCSFLLVEKPFTNLEGALLARLLGGASGKAAGREAARAAAEDPGPLLQQAPPWQPLADPAAAPASDGVEG